MMPICTEPVFTIAIAFPYRIFTFKKYVSIERKRRELWATSNPLFFPLKIMPQLLNYLRVDSLGESIDWGTLVVYTCAESCGDENEYVEEFIWKQDFSTSSIEFPSSS